MGAALADIPDPVAPVWERNRGSACQPIRAERLAWEAKPGLATQGATTLLA